MKTEYRFRLFIIFGQFPQQDSKSAPLITEEDGIPPSREIHFKVLHIPQIDSIFNDFERTLNPFVENRIALYIAVNAVKQAVESFQEIHPNATFKFYVNSLKTTLEGKSILMKIKEGVVTLDGAVEKSEQLAITAKDAVEKIWSVSEKIYNMVPTITGAAEDCARRCSNLDVKYIIKRECSDLKEVMKAGQAFKENCKMMKKSPKMVTDFSKEISMIIQDMVSVFGEEKENACDDNEGDKNMEAKQSSSKQKQGKEREKEKEKKTEKMEKETENQKKEERKREATKKEGEDYEEALKMEYVNVPDIDCIFQDFARAVNPFVESRKSIETTKKSFETVMQSISNFDIENELQTYLKELKKKASEGGIHLHIDVTDGKICSTTISGLPAPEPYKGAMKCLNEMKQCAMQLLEMEGKIENAIQSVLDDVARINPSNDLRRALNFKDLLKIRGKLKKLSSNIKKMQKAPKIVKDFFVCIKETLADIKECFEGDE